MHGPHYALPGFIMLFIRDSFNLVKARYGVSHMPSIIERLFTLLWKGILAFRYFCSVLMSKFRHFIPPISIKLLTSKQGHDLIHKNDTQQLGGIAEVLPDSAAVQLPRMLTARAAS